MIRVVLAVVLAIALVGVAVPALEYGAGVNSEQQVGSEVAKIGNAATSLVENEELPPPGQSGAQRVVSVSLPGDSRTTRPVEHLEIERHGNRSVATYRVEGRSEQVAHIDAPIVNGTNDTVELGGSGTRDLVLTLERDGSEAPVIVLERE